MFRATVLVSACLLALFTAGAGQEKSPLPEEGLPISAAEKQAVARLQQAGVLVLRLAMNTNWLYADFSLRHQPVRDEELAWLQEIPNLVELNLAGTNVGDSQMTLLAKLPHLRVLKLQKTAVTDAGLKSLTTLRHLEVLNLYGTQVTDQGLMELAQLKTLRRLYVWDTKVTEAGAKKLQAAVPGLHVELGLATVPEKTSPAESKPPAPSTAKPVEQKPVSKPAKPPDKSPQKPG